MSRMKLGHVSIEGFQGSGIKLQATEDPSDNVGHGIVCVGFPEVELTGDVSLSNLGLNGLHVGADVAAIVRGRLRVSNNHMHGILVEPDSNFLKDDIARMDTLLNLPALQTLRDDLSSILAEISQELEQPRPNANEILSLLFAAKNFLSKAVKQTLTSPELTEIYNLVCHRVELARLNLSL